MKLNCESLEIQKWNIPTDRTQKVNEKNKIICLVIFTSRVMVIKMTKNDSFFAFSADDSKKLVTVWEKNKCNWKILSAKNTETLVDILLMVAKNPIIYSIFAQKVKLSINDSFSKCDQIRSFQRILSYLLRKSLMENSIFCAVTAFFYLLFELYMLVLFIFAFQDLQNSVPWSAPFALCFGP